MKTHDELIIDSLFSEGGTLAGLQQAFRIDQTFKNGVLVDEKKNPVFIRQTTAKRATRDFKKNQTYFELIAEYHTLERVAPFKNGDVISFCTLEFHGDKYLKRSVIEYV